MNHNLIVMVLLYILMDIFLFYIMHIMNFSVWFIALVLILFNCEESHPFTKMLCVIDYKDLVIDY